MMPKFKCIRCGECCSHIRGLISDDDKKFLSEFGYGKLPLVQMHPIEKMSFPLFDFEAKRFLEWAKEVKVEPKIEESRVIFDLERNKTIVVTYHMDADSCPFLKDKKCLIYDKYRAFICRLFPFNKGPFLSTGDALSKEGMFGSCPAISEIIEKLDDSDIKVFVKQLHEAFGDDFLNIVQFDYMMEFLNKMIIELMKEKKLRPAMNYPYEFLMKRIKNSEKIDLMDFLISEGIKSRQEAESLIKRFDNNYDAKDKLNGYF